LVVMRRLDPVFFSSRRRHASAKRDWSSDVCSSDLLLYFATSRKENILYSLYLISGLTWIALSYGLISKAFNVYGDSLFILNLSRSEERRVGKEGRRRRGAGRGEQRSGQHKEQRV